MARASRLLIFVTIALGAAASPPTLLPAQQTQPPAQPVPPGTAPVVRTRAPRKRPPTPDELRAITRRGQLLAAYDQAGWGATDAVTALHPADGSITHYIAQPTADSWRVSFGRLTPSRDTFLVAYEARYTVGDSIFRATALTPPRGDTGYLARAARAIDAARAAFGPVQRPYNVAVIPATLGEWWVYMYPASTQPGVWPLGGDTRYLVSADGRTIRAHRRLHNAIIEYAAKPGQKVEAYTHAAVLDDVPEDTDVLAVLSRTPRAPEYIVTDAFVYRIDVDGTIHLMGSRKALLGDHQVPDSTKH